MLESHTTSKNKESEESEDESESESKSEPTTSVASTVKIEGDKVCKLGVKCTIGARFFTSQGRLCTDLEAVSMTLEKDGEVFPVALEGTSEHGCFTGTYSINRPGTYNLYCFVGGNKVVSEPFVIEASRPETNPHKCIVNGLPSTITAAKPVIFTIQTVDNSGVNQIAGGDRLALSGLPYSVRDNNDGTYTATIQAVKTASSAISILQKLL
jgi:hypothetical protein